MYSPEGERLAVLDWEMVTLGSPSQDVAWAWFLDRHHSEALDVPRLEGFPSKEETSRTTRARAASRCETFDFYEVFAGFRFCVIMARLAVIFKDWGLLAGRRRDGAGEHRHQAHRESAGGARLLSPLDDLPIHQVAETMANVGTSDRNFYDRYYFNLHGCDDDFFLAGGIGQYPNLDVTDAFVCVNHGDTQTVVRASRPLGLDRLDTRVGPASGRGPRGAQAGALRLRGDRRASPWT